MATATTTVPSAASLYYRKNRERILARARAAYQANKEPFLKNSREWAKKNPDKVAVANKKAYANTKADPVKKAKAAAASKAWSLKNKEKTKEYQRKHAAKKSAAAKKPSNGLEGSLRQVGDPPYRTHASLQIDAAVAGWQLMQAYGFTDGTHPLKLQLSWNAVNEEDARALEAAYLAKFPEYKLRVVQRRRKGMKLWEVRHVRLLSLPADETRITGIASQALNMGYKFDCEFDSSQMFQHYVLPRRIDQKSNNVVSRVKAWLANWSM